MTILAFVVPDLIPCWTIPFALLCVLSVLTVAASARWGLRRGLVLLVATASLLFLVAGAASAQQKPRPKPPVTTQEEGELPYPWDCEWCIQTFGCVWCFLGTYGGCRC